VTSARVSAPAGPAPREGGRAVVVPGARPAIGPGVDRDVDDCVRSAHLQG
jgi:hypothetical protein